MQNKYEARAEVNPYSKKYWSNGFWKTIWQKIVLHRKDLIYGAVVLAIILPIFTILGIVVW
jgi:hypothetical protein